MKEHKPIELECEPNAGHDWAFWWGVMGAPVIWAIQLQAEYSFAPVTCHIGTHIPLYVFTILCIILALIGTVISHHQWRTMGSGSPDQTDGGHIARRRFNGGLGMIISLTFAIVILAQGLSAVFFDACWS